MRHEQRVEVVNGLIAEISKRVNDIGDAIGLINGISSQTNLLTMNAAIEAAHAGEFGKDFAVVAKEIRCLAESSGENANRVTTVLKDIIDKIRRTQDASTQSSSSFARIGTDVTEVVQAFSQITEEIRTASGKMHQGARQINAAQVEFSRISSESKEAVDDVAQRAAAPAGTSDRAR